MNARRRQRFAIGAVVLCLAACDGQAPPEEFWRPWYAAPGGEPVEPTDPVPDMRNPSDARGSDGGPGGCTLSVSVTTASAGGRYAPRNIGAIWISDANDRFVKTLHVWAEKRAKYLKRWNEVTAVAGLPANRTDAVSGATRSSHGMRTGSWSCTNTAAMPVADGAYKVCFELTDYDGPGPYDCVMFTKSKAPVSLMPADLSSFKARKLELSP